ncbi:MAG: hypothetical protein ACRENH_16015, partial [Gemmatimonadaceae bacterium]
LQMGMYPLALLWRNPFAGNAYRGNARLREWIIGAVEHTLGRQKPNGAFEAFAPNDFDPGPTLGICYALSKVVDLLNEGMDTELRARVTSAVRRGAEFGLQYEQSHGFASNHWGLFACAYLHAATLTSDSRYRVRAQEIVARILRLQSEDGWYNEYGGADPGYESLGISYLAHYWAATHDSSVLESLRRSIDFYAHCVHPDGSVGGVYGSRHTSLYFPAGFELLANMVPSAAAISRFMRQRLTRGNVVTPATTDAHNLIPLVASYLEAEDAVTEQAPSEALPCERTAYVKHFTGSGIGAVATTRYYAVINSRKGGVCRVFDRDREILSYEDAGYIVQAGKRRWISQTLGFGQATDVGERSLTLETRFSEFHQLLPTPANYLVLRILALTLFRSAAIGAWIRDRVVRRLIAAARPGPLTLRRRIAFAPDAITISDELYLLRKGRIDALALMRAHTGIHAGSAKYYHQSDEQAAVDGDWNVVAAALTGTGRAQFEIRVDIAAAKSVASP